MKILAFLFLLAFGTASGQTTAPLQPFDLDQLIEAEVWGMNGVTLYQTGARSAKAVVANAYSKAFIRVNGRFQTLVLQDGAQTKEVPGRKEEVYTATYRNANYRLDWIVTAPRTENQQKKLAATKYRMRLYRASDRKLLLNLALVEGDSAPPPMEVLEN